MIGIHPAIRSVSLALVAIVVVGLAPAREARAFTTMYNCNSAWPSASLPVSYRVTDAVTSVGTAASTLDELRALYRAAFEEWASPCCSAFSATDTGTTTASGNDRSDSINAITVLTDSWPRSYGNSNVTLGVTWTAVDGRCEIVSSDVIFNAVSWSYSDGGGGNTVDLQSIATHEFGHFIGLGHTNVQAATMFSAYTGPGQRSLHSDDEDGVCTLYEQACNCSSNAECNGNQDCIDSVCQVPPCTSDLDCEAGLACNEFGDCIVPPCGGDADCVPGNVCQSGSCVPDADCPICGQCETNADCGTNGVCIPAGFISANSACTSWCQSAADCPGNTECFTVPTQDGDVPLCFNADADTRGACPSGFVCQADDGPFDACDGVTCPSGQVCNSLTGQCQGGGSPDSCAVCESCSGSDAECGAGGTCLAFDGGPTACSVACGADGSCPGNSSCFQLTDGAGGTENWCLNDNAATAGVCGGGWQCTDPNNLCEGVSCPSGQACNPGSGVCETGAGGDFDVPDTGDPAVNQGGGAGDDGGGCQVVADRPGSAAQALWLALAGLALIVGRRRRV